MAAKTREEKVALFFLILAGFGGVIFGARYLGLNLTRPFQFTSDDDYILGADREAAEVEAMKERDTDGDGLSDYDERYIYETSAYLADSDSDSFDDAMEIKSGNDPNCPAGRECSVAEESVDLGEALVEELEPPEGDINELLAQLEALSGADGNEEIDDLAAVSDLTVEELRTLLKSYGLSEDQLNALSDEKLMKIYEEALVEISKNAE